VTRSVVAKGRLCGLFTLCSLAVVNVAAADCTVPQLSAQRGVVHSRWQEFNAQGQRLVNESGRLQNLGVRMEATCLGVQWAASASQAQGTRDYDGTSSTGQALQTQSQVRQTQLQLEAWQPLDQTLDLGMRLGWTVVDRDLASVGAVRGYPEQFRYLQAALGLRYSLADVGGVRLGLHAWLGGGPGGTVQVQLPNLDPAQLRLGSSQLAQLGLQLEPVQALAGMPGWSWRLRLQWQQEQMRAGPGQTITRNGLPVGGAAQPKTRQSATGLDAGLQYRF
jgi:hypothetical protein